jgi:hypothetical protein
MWWAVRPHKRQSGDSQAKALIRLLCDILEGVLRLGEP